MKRKKKISGKRLFLNLNFIFRYSSSSNQNLNPGLNVFSEKSLDLLYGFVIILTGGVIHHKAGQELNEIWYLFSCENPFSFKDNLLGHHLFHCDRPFLALTLEFNTEGIGKGKDDV